MSKRGRMHWPNCSLRTDRWPSSLLHLSIKISHISVSLGRIVVIPHLLPQLPSEAKLLADDWLWILLLGSASDRPQNSPGTRFILSFLSLSYFLDALCDYEPALNSQVEAWAQSCSHCFQLAATGLLEFFTVLGWFISAHIYSGCE